MTDGIRGTARDGRLPSIKLNPVEDGTTRDRSEIGAANIPWHVKVMEVDYSTGKTRVMPNRATFAGERKSIEPAHADAMAPRVTGRRGDVWYEAKMRLDGLEHGFRAIRTTDMDDDAPLPSVPKIDKPARAPRTPRSTTGRPARAAASSGVDKPARSADVDAYIRSLGHTGPIDKIMRNAVRDVWAHQAGVAAYAGTAPVEPPY